MHSQYPYIALLMQQAEIAGHKAVTAQEREAYAHPEYIELLHGLMAAIEQEESLKWKLELFKMRFEMWRTQQATQRAEMNLR